jgi:hypothetical protein
MSDEPMDRDPIETFKRDVLEPMAESLQLRGILDEVAEEHAASLRADPEWTTGYYFHQRTLIEAFMYGVTSADELFLPYRLPDDFSGVVNFIADRMHRHWNGEIVPRVSLLEIKGLFAEWAWEHPSYRKWCEDPPGAPTVVVVTAYDRPGDGPPEDRARVSHEVVGHNAAIYLRNEHRRTEAFDREFDRQMDEVRAAGMLMDED